jgi:hypothetical protein
MGEWLRWGIDLLIAGLFFLIGWRWPRSARPTPIPPPDLRLVQVGGLGGSSETVKAKLELVNDGIGTARNWQVTISNGSSRASVAVMDLHTRTGGQAARWHQDADVGEIPPHQSRELTGWLSVHRPGNTLEIVLPVELEAESMTKKTGQLVVTFDATAPASSMRFEL